MNDYEKLINKANGCTLKAVKYYNSGDFNLAAFYNNASRGYYTRALKCVIIDLRG